MGSTRGILECGNSLMSLHMSQGRNREAIKLADTIKKSINIKGENPTDVSLLYNRTALALGYVGLNEASMKTLDQQ